jgi:hypothetical protein
MKKWNPLLNLKPAVAGHEPPLASLTKFAPKQSSVQTKSPAA